MLDEQMREYQRKLSQSCPFEVLAQTLGELFQTTGEEAIARVNRQLRINPLTRKIQLTHRLPPLRPPARTRRSAHPLAHP